MKKNIFKAIKTFIVSSALFAFAACSNILTDGSNNSSSVTAEKAKVTFNISTSAAKTILPNDVDLTSYYYMLSATDTTGSDATSTDLLTERVQITSESSSLSAEIKAGTYDFTVTAYDAATNGNKVLVGKASSVTISSASLAVTIKMYAAQGGTGTVTATLQIAKEMSVATVSTVVSETISATDTGTKTAVTSGTDYATFTYTNESFDSGVSKYLVFFLYDSSNTLVTSYVDSVYVVRGKTSSKIIPITTATFVATVTVTKDGNAWSDSGIEITLVPSSSTDTSTGTKMTATSGAATYTANLTADTYKVYVGNNDKGKTVSSSAPTATLDYDSDAVYPNLEASNAFGDTQLLLSFSSAPTLTADSTIYIYKAEDDSLADSITVKSSTKNEFLSLQSGYTVTVGNQQLVHVGGANGDSLDTNTVYIQPHIGALSWGTEYYVVIGSDVITTSDTSWTGYASKEWSFTTKSAPNVTTGGTVTSPIAISVSNATSSNSADYFSVYGAIATAAAKASGVYEIDISAGEYYELVSVQGKGAHIILKGQGTAAYGSDVVIEYVNNVYMNDSTHTRPSFYFKGSGDLTFENVTLKNLTKRATSYTADGSHASSEYQAEALYYYSTSYNLNAYNSSFVSLQDTVKADANKTWFYGCYVAGDVDFMWGTSNVALFENCAIECLADSTLSNDNAYLFETRVGSTSATTVGKGYVLLNSTVTVDSGVTAYYARRASAKSSTSYYDQAALVNVTFDSAPADAHWYVGNEPESLTGTLYGDYADVGWKEYNVTVSGTAVSTTSRYAKSGVITSTEYANEYSGRRAILNRYYDSKNKCYAKDSTTNWDVATLISGRGYTVDPDGSSETLSGESEVTSVVWNTGDANLSQTRNQTFYMYTDLSTTTTAPTGDALYNYLYCDGSKNDYIQGSLELYGTAAIYIPVTTASTATIAFTKGAGTLTIAGKDYTANGNVEIDCSTATLVTLNEIKYIEVRVNGTAGGTADKYYITSVTVVTASSSSSSSSGTTASDSDIIIDNGTVISDSDTSSRSNTLSVIKGETPTGYAGVGYSSSYSSSSYTNGTVTVSTRSDLVKYAKAGGYFIIVDGMIDMTDGMLPSVGGGTTDELDSFVADTSGNTYSSYSDWVAKYAAACSLTSDDEKKSTSTNTSLYADLWELSDNYKKQIQLVIASNTAIVGANADSGIKGATISISGVSNVVLRNLNIRDAYDPFPHHEVKDGGVTSDGYNAQWDCITIQDKDSSNQTKYVWIDHCTFEDTMSLCHGYTGGTNGTSEKWQTYDGLLDIKGLGQYITVSYCKFKNHDKTSLIGSSDTDGDADTRLITYHHNYFYNCGQRLPMVRKTTMHLYNNYYAYSSGDYSQQNAVGVRKGSTIYAENNYFDSGIKYAFSDSGSSSSSGTLYSVGNTNNASSGTSLTNSVTATLFTAPTGYPTYTLETAATVQANLPSEVGAGAVTISDAAVSTTANDISIAYETTSYTLDLGGTKIGTNALSITGANASNASVSYASSDTSVATVDASTGEVTAVAIGVATITATESTTAKTATYSLVVKDTTAVKDTYEITLTTAAKSTNKTKKNYDFGLFSVTNGAWNDGTHGWVFEDGSTITFRVNGASTITLGSCNFNSSATSTATAAAGTYSESQAVLQSCSSSYTFTYSASDAADITITFSGTTYVPYVKVASASYSSTIKASALFDFRTLFSELPTSGSSASGSIKADGGEITYSKMYYKDKTHGAYMYQTSTITFTVSGACTIYLGKDAYNGATYTIAAVNSENASVDSSLSATTIDAGIQNTGSAATLASSATDLTATGAAAVSFKYTGTSAATITISVTGGSATNYLPAMQVVF